jgi:hypothetical protein
MPTYQIIGSQFSVYDIVSDAETPQRLLDTLPTVIVDGVVFIKTSYEGFPLIMAKSDISAVRQTA